MDLMQSDHARMKLAIELSAASVIHGGGPFGAVIVAPATGEIISIGANLVLPAKSSLCHAEVVAILLAQQELRHHDLGSTSHGPLELYTSCEPCVMCMGAIFWSGIKKIHYAAEDQDARQAGFDEGPKSQDWNQYLTERGFSLVAGQLRSDAQKVLQDYASQGGMIYNP